MKIYVSGPITGYPNDNRDAFALATKALREQGHEVFNPLEHDVPDASTSERAWTSALRRDIIAIAECDGIAVLDGFHHSKGSMLEIHTALALRLKLVCIPGQSADWCELVEREVTPSLKEMWRNMKWEFYQHHAVFLGDVEMKS